MNDGSREYDQLQDDGVPEKRFRGWRLLGYLGIVVLVLAIVSALVDWYVLGPLLGRAF